MKTILLLACAAIVLTMGASAASTDDNRYYDNGYYYDNGGNSWGDNNGYYNNDYYDNGGNNWRYQYQNNGNYSDYSRQRDWYLQPERRLTAIDRPKFATAWLQLHLQPRACWKTLPGQGARPERPQGQTLYRRV